MALHGTIKDFALPDIFQLIGIQRKTGLLTLESDDDRVTIKFLDGQVVGADTRTESLEDRLGSVLVRTGRITQAQLRDALKTQRNTLQRLGHILVNGKLITEQELVDALNVQSSQIIYRLFRWRDGSYHFDAVEDLEYDQKHFVPISSETILMEGARMIDEWPIIERRVRSGRVVFRKTADAESLDHNIESIIEDDIELDLFGSDGGEDALDGREEPGSAPGTVTLSRDERDVLSLVDGVRTVSEICDLLSLGEFDVYRLLAELQTRNLIEENRHRIEDREQVDRSLLRRAVEWAAGGGLAAAVLLALVGLPHNDLTPWNISPDRATSDRLHLYASLARMERIEQAIRIYYLDASAYPTNLAALTQRGLLRPADLQDPWGRPYQYALSRGGYRLTGLDGSGEPADGLVFSRQFNSVERMMVPDGAAEPAAGRE